jgi:hypothetical protein
MLIVIMAGFFFSCSSYGKAKGTVLDKLTGKPISGVSVSIKGSAISAVTDDKGIYLLKGIVPGNQIIVATKTGYCLGETEQLAFAKGALTKVTDTFMMLSPSDYGIFRIKENSNTLTPVSFLKERQITNFWGDKLYFPSRLGPFKTLNSDFKFLVKSAHANNVKSVQLLNTHYLPPTVEFWNAVPDRWSLGNSNEDVQIDMYKDNVYYMHGNLKSGVYAIYVNNEDNESWYYFFNVGQGSQPQNAVSNAGSAVDTTLVAK